MAKVGSKKYTWTIPTDLDADDYLIRITSGKVSADSEEFEIKGVDASLEITDPSSGSGGLIPTPKTFVSGSDMTIKWKSTNIPSSASVNLVLNSWSLLQSTKALTIVKGAQNTGQYK